MPASAPDTTATAMRPAPGIFRAVLYSLALSVPVCDALAQAYPARPIRLIVSFAPGGSVDLVARLMGQKLSEAWGQQVVIDNRPGAGGNLSAEVHKRLVRQGVEPIGSTSAQLASHLKSELAKWAKVVKLSGARVD